MDQLTERLHEWADTAPDGMPDAGKVGQHAERDRPTPALAAREGHGELCGSWGWAAQARPGATGTIHGVECCTGQRVRR